MRTVKELKALDGDLLENALKELQKAHRHVRLFVLYVDDDTGRHLWRCYAGGRAMDATSPMCAVFGHIVHAEHGWPAEVDK